ncbi:MAG: hypothetical protein V3U75_13610 [Methylococcaceae bacterium]
MMKQAQLQSLCSAGAVSNASIVHAMLSEKWNLQLDVKQNGKTETIVLHSKRGKVRDFSSIEATLKTIKEIGLGEARIVIE